MYFPNERKTINSLKGIAILGIMLVHSGCTLPGILNVVVKNGARGVQLMFLINGYLIFKSLDNARGKGLTLKQWYRGKFIRIIPLYWLFTILHLLVFGTGERFWIGPLKRVSGLNIICNLLCIHGFFPYYINSINLNWFIADLAIWYLIAPVCHRLFDSLEKLLGCLMLIIPINYTFLFLIGRYPPISNEGIWYDYTSILCFPAELPIILLGCVIYYIGKEGKNVNIHKATSYKCLFFAFACLPFLCAGSDNFNIYSRMFSFGICFAIIMLSQLVHPIVLLNNSFFAVFGKYSYGIYLCHIFIIHMINIFLPGGGTMSSQIGKYLLICTLSLMVAVYVESAYGRLINNKHLQRN